ncbi:MAG: hypothetical protein RMX54_05205 [Planktomarina sp.]|jgi:hypothetical protein|nr:hypothetical protein [Planktomarina sp.]MDT2077657.1 hypothetical protein [Planktomarina sp.]|tara:strand:- start:443 stop:718 length:276 start_codon:yes stop_codon:yes gene_type:complete
MTNTVISNSQYYINLRAGGVKHSFTNAVGNLVNCYGVSDEEANHYELFVGSEQEGLLENPDKLGWAEVSSFLEEQPDNWNEVFGASNLPEE